MKIFRIHIFLLFICSFCISACSQSSEQNDTLKAAVNEVSVDTNISPNVKKLVDAAFSQVGVTVSYDPAYVQLKYPDGDVPLSTGVCTDVVIRAFRKVNIDLQKELHEDMLAHFDAYPNLWGLTKPDANIDHRRVQNLDIWFKRKGKSISITNADSDYKPGDVVAWRLSNGLLHIGLVSNIWNDEKTGYKMIHNIGDGAQCEDVLFNWTIIGHYRYF